MLCEKKTGKERRLLLNQKVRNTILAYTKGMGDEEYLFPSYQTDKPITRIQSYRILRDAAKETGLDSVGTHTLQKMLSYFLSAHEGCGVAPKYFQSFRTEYYTSVYRDHVRYY